MNRRLSQALIRTAIVIVAGSGVIILHDFLFWVYKERVRVNTSAEIIQEIRDKGDCESLLVSVWTCIKSMQSETTGGISGESLNDADIIACAMRQYEAGADRSTRVLDDIGFQLHMHLDTLHRDSAGVLAEVSTKMSRARQETGQYPVLLTNGNIVSRSESRLLSHHRSGTNP